MVARMAARSSSRLGRMLLTMAILERFLNNLGSQVGRLALGWPHAQPDPTTADLDGDRGVRRRGAADRGGLERRRGRRHAAPGSRAGPGSRGVAACAAVTAARPDGGGRAGL